ncbi:MAG: 2-succinyl-5-enolpyruvyl-6-hydroxy-3-cyclohexene-1-carboxylic-acid synthase [Verrucomicrobiae bacterium]|nr:2-succinyl-5-enolpyruvyl-6-hydroxy-3-cyclohexene-1-carboxylic-acid synthase [Verrucomicrobiae bacterium]
MNALARAVLAACSRAGVAEYVVCAGARNAALVMPLAAMSELDDCPVRVWHFSEERAAGFFALGRARALQRPVAVVTTSGTAVAELLPPMVEAFYQNVPLLAVTADRPASFRGTGAPQAIEQAGIFGGYAVCAVDVETVEAAEICLDGWDLGQPAHLNVCLPEPGREDCQISPNDIEALAPAVPLAIGQGKDSRPELDAFLGSARHLVVLLGSNAPGNRGALTRLLLELGAPILAEAVSGYREAPELQHLIVRGGDRSAARLAVGSVLRIGDVPVWRVWRDLETRSDVPVFSVTMSGFSGLARPSTVVRSVDWDGAVGSQHQPFDGGREVLEQILAEFPRSECGLVRWLSLEVPPGAVVFLGNSLPVREWNLAASTADRGLRCYANRGANGIDGILSTALGLCADEDECWIAVGDLTTLYDLSAPWVLEQISCRKVRIAVLNNGGGRIFSRLPNLKAVSRTQKEMMENSHGIGFQHWAAMWGMDYVCVRGPQPVALEESPCVIEIQPDSGQTESFCNKWEQC